MTLRLLILDSRLSSDYLTSANRRLRIEDMDADLNDQYASNQE